MLSACGISSLPLSKPFNYNTASGEPARLVLSSAGVGADGWRVACSEPGKTGTEIAESRPGFARSHSGQCRLSVPCGCIPVNHEDNSGGPQSQGGGLGCRKEAVCGGDLLESAFQEEEHLPSLLHSLNPYPPVQSHSL